jgi:hypothetical protein
MASLSYVPTAASISASNVSQLLFTDVAFSTTVGGRTYTADVISSDGEYVASDPNLAGAQATGPNVEDAENNEIARIDFFA